MKKPIDPVIHVPGEVSVERLAEAEGILLTWREGVLHGACPFHPSKKPTLQINPTTNLWSCTKCRVKNVTVVRWIMKAERVSQRRALEMLEQGYPPKLAE